MQLFAQTPPVVINSYRDSNLDNEEWTELIITQDNVDLRGFTIRDNSSSGNWQPFVRFKHVDYWNHLRRGTIIVLFHRNPAAQSTFSNQLNTDKRDGHIAFSLENSTYFEYEGGGSISLTSMSLSVTGDMVQLRNASDAHIHALGHRLDTTSNFDYWGLLPRPKLNHRANLVSANKEAVMVTPGANIEQLGMLSPINGLTYTSKGNKGLPGLPNVGNASENANFWRSLRQPDWINPTLTASYNPQTQQVSLNWNAMTDAYPADEYQGYLILRSTTNAFQSPQDGVIHGIGNLLGNAVVIGLVNGSNNTSFVDNLSSIPIPCGSQYYYRIYPYRYGPDDIDQGAGPARGRAYNESSFAAASAANPVPSTSISISASAQNVTPGTQVTFSATLNNPGSNPIITWYVNDVQQQSSASTTFTWTFTTSATVKATLQSSLSCATASNSNTIQITVTANPCNPGVIQGPSILCPNQSAQFTTNGTPGGIWTSSNTSIATVNNGLVTPLQPGIFTLRYTVDNSSCIGTNFVEKEITINPPPYAGMDQQLCNTKTASLTASIPLAGQGFWLVADVPPGILEFPVFLNGMYNPLNVVSVPEFGTYVFSWSIEGCGTDLITITFQQNEPLSLSLSPVNPEVCPGQSVTFTAQPSNTTGSNNFQWYKNGSPSGTNSPTYTLSEPAEGDQVAVRYQTNAFCVSPSEITAGPVMVSVLPAIVAPTLATASHTQLCSGTSETITLTAFGGYGVEVHWYSGSCGGTPIGTGTDLDIPAPTQTTTYYARWETPGCGTSECKSVTINVLPQVQPSVSIEASKTTICANETVTFTANVQNGGTSPQYQWYKNGVLTGDNAPVFSAEGWQHGDQIECVLISNATCVSPQQANSNTIQLTVHPMITPSLTIGPSIVEACVGSIINFSITEISGQGNSPQYQWFIDGIPATGATGNTFSLQVVSNVSVNCRLISSETCATSPMQFSNTVQVVVQQQITPQIVISASQNQLCQGVVASFNAEINGGGNNPQYQWRVNGVPANGANQSLFVLQNPANDDMVDCILTSSAACATQPTANSNAVTLQVSPNLPVTAIINAAQYQGPVCQGTNLQFSANTSNGGQSPVYQWFLNDIPVSSQAAFTYTFDQPGNYQVRLAFTSSLNCTLENPVISNILDIVVLPNLPVSVQLQASQTAACENTTILLSAQPQHPGQTPQYEWLRNGTFFSTTTVNQLSINGQPGDQWQVRLISSEQCAVNSPALSAVVALEIDPLPTAPQIIQASHTQLCLNSAVNITLSAQGGSGQQLRWFADACGQNPIGSGNPLIISAPQQSTTYYAHYTSGLCAPSPCAEVHITVNDIIVPALQIAGPNTQLCLGETASFAVVSQSGQGITPQYEWFVNGVAQGVNAVNFSYQPDNGDIVQCQLQSAEACAQPSVVLSAPVVTSVSQPVQPMVSIQAAEDTVCFTQPIIINSTIVNGGSAPTYQWMVNNNHYGEVNPIFHWYAPSPGTYQIYLLATSSLSCVTIPTAFSQVVNITVLPQIEPAVSISTPTTTLCSGDQAIVSAAFTNQGQEPMFQWFKNGQPIPGETNTVLSFMPNDNDWVYCQMVSSVRCASPALVTSNSLTFSISGIVQPSAVLQSPANQVCEGSQVTFTAMTTGGGDQPTITWFVNNIASGGGQSFTYAPQNGDQIHYILNSSLSCAQPASVSSNTVVMQVAPLLEVAVSIEANQSEMCQGTEVAVTATGINGGSNPEFSWYLNGNLILNGTNPLLMVPQNGDQVHCVMTSSEQCVIQPGASSQPITFSTTPVVEPQISIQPNQSQYCEGDAVTITASVNVSGPDDVYQWFVNGAAAGTNAAVLQLAAGPTQTIQCMLISSVACASPAQASSGEITVQGLPLLTPSVSIGANQQEVCAGTTVSFEASWQHGGNNPGFQWLVNGLLSGNQAVFSYAPSDDDIVQCVLISDYACASPATVGSESTVMRVSEDLAMTLQKTNAGCNGGTGTITADGAAGKPPYSYRIEGLTDWQENGSFTDLPPGNYLVILKDLYGCQLSEPVVIESESGPEITDVQQLPASNGYNNAGLNIIAQGTPPLAFSIDQTNWQSSGVFAGLPAAPIMVYVRDGNGCITQQLINIETLPVNITAGQGAVCAESQLSVPISTDGFAAATRILLELKFDDKILSFSSLSQLHTALSAANLSVTHQAGIVRLLFESTSGMNMPGGGLMMHLVFNTMATGNSLLKWEPASVIQSQHQAALGANFISGLVTVWPVPEITIEHQIRHCLGKALEIDPKIAGNIQNILWTLPDGSSSNTQKLLIETPGWSQQGAYRLVVTNNFGCNRNTQTEVILLP
ncbi:MAG TPA: PKD domain-containing protein, partial [Bacteroidales bacterium]|nr:PKD domain-containing protein [Bacteroidales bacterium]